jgi:hypothetical protein
MCIAQLCIAFTLLLWHMSQPFVGDLFRVKAQLLVFEEVMGALPASPDAERLAHSAQNKERFQALPTIHQATIAAGYARAQKQKARPFLDKLKSSLSILWNDISPFEKGWIMLSIIIPILLLKQVEGAHLAVWLVPLITACYIGESRMHDEILRVTAHEQLFPSEQYLVERYGNGALAESITEQHQQLKSAWERYLVDVWSDGDGEVATGAYAFHVARAKALVADSAVPQVAPQRKIPWTLAALLLSWNLLFALSPQHLPRF